jgi:hypothetical protein
LGEFSKELSGKASDKGSLSVNFIRVASEKDSDLQTRRCDYFCEKAKGKPLVNTSGFVKGAGIGTEVFIHLYYFRPSSNTLKPEDRSRLYDAYHRVLKGY